MGERAVEDASTKNENVIDGDDHRFNKTAGLTTVINGTVQQSLYAGASEMLVNGSLARSESNQFSKDSQQTVSTGGVSKDDRFTGQARQILMVGGAL